MGVWTLTRFGRTAVACLGLLALGAGCHGASKQPEETRSSVMPARSYVVTGTVHHVDLEGGFYGIVTDDGQHLDPVNLPKEFQKDGLRLEARVVPLRDRVSAHMWGTPVRIIEFKRL